MCSGQRRGRSWDSSGCAGGLRAGRQVVGSRTGAAEAQQRLRRPRPMPQSNPPSRPPCCLLPPLLHSLAWPGLMHELWPGPRLRRAAGHACSALCRGSGLQFSRFWCLSCRGRGGCKGAQVTFGAWAHHAGPGPCAQASKVGGRGGGRGLGTTEPPRYAGPPCSSPKPRYVPRYTAAPSVHTDGLGTYRYRALSYRPNHSLGLPLTRSVRTETGIGTRGVHAVLGIPTPPRHRPRCIPTPLGRKLLP
jgi:hypothetical protein